MCSINAAAEKLFGESPENRQDNAGKTPTRGI